MKQNSEATPGDETVMKLLRQSVGRIGNDHNDVAPTRDLWPTLLRRLDKRQTAPWFDWALLAGVAVMVAMFPAAIPVFLYSL